MCLQIDYPSPTNIFISLNFGQIYFWNESSLMAPTVVCGEWVNGAGVGSVSATNAPQMTVGALKQLETVSSYNFCCKSGNEQLLYYSLTFCNYDTLLYDDGWWHYIWCIYRYGILYIRQYGIVFDAGSSHTSMYLYHWESDKINNTGKVEQITSCDIKGG